jgi:hypothetical protein
LAGPAACGGPEFCDDRDDGMNWECSETATELCTNERCLCLPFDDGERKFGEGLGSGGAGARCDVLGGFTPSAGKCSSSCTETAAGGAWGDGGGGLGDLSGRAGVGIMGTFGCVIVCSHVRSWPSSSGISGMPLKSKRLLTMSGGSVMQVNSFIISNSRRRESAAQMGGLIDFPTLLALLTSTVNLSSDSSHATSEDVVSSHSPTDKVVVIVGTLMTVILCSLLRVLVCSGRRSDFLLL